MADSEVDPLIGKVLSGRFEILAPIGMGGMGRVYKALQQPLDRVVALKVLNPRYDGSRDPGFEKRFFLEASMTARLHHPNTITVHDYGRTDDGIYFIAMEYLEGETLQKVLADVGRLPWARALFIAGQVARSLREAHRLGLVHRDLKPANVMLLTEGTSGDTVKVLDFGLVKSFTPEPGEQSDGRSGDDLERTGLTQAGVLLGSPLYMAPEQARGEADPRTDIYALGVLLFQMMAGKPPFVSKESIDVIVKHLREKPPELVSLVPEVPVDVNALVMKCLEKRPEARFQSMDEVLDAMRAATAGQGLSGAFADPRTASGLVPRASTPGMPLAAPQATPAATSDEAVRSHEVEVQHAATDRPTSRLPLLVAVVTFVALGATLGGVLAFRSKAPVEPAPPAETRPAPAPAPTVTPPPPAPLPEVRFAVTSEPPGARVTRGGVEVGVTPFALTVPRDGDQPVQAEFHFSLAGYREQTVVAQGLHGEVMVSTRLEKEPPPKQPTGGKRVTRPPKPPDGYKDDPY
jgi:serine/threonine-protein kinase